MPINNLAIRNLEYIRQVLTERDRIYQVYEKYYLGIQYDAEVRQLFRLYAGIREYYSMVSRAVDINTELIPGGWLTTASQDEVNAILERSEWDKEGKLFCHYGTMFGDVYLKLVGANGELVIEPLSPRGVWLDEERSIIVRNKTDLAGSQYEVIEEITPKYYRRYVAGRLEVNERHDYGFIPVFYAQNKDVGLQMGLNCFHSVLNEINSVNEVASLLHEAIMRALNAQKVITGAQATEGLLGPDKIVFLPMGAKFDMVSAEVDVSGTLEFVMDIKTELRNSLPEFVFDTLRAPGLERPNSYDALWLYAQELVAKIKLERVNYDKALQAAIDGIAQLEGLDLGDWKFDPNRPVFPYYVTPTEEVEDDVQS